MEYIRTLENEYLKRKQKNQKYSIRAFSNYLGIQSSTLSAVLKKNRHLSLKDAEAAASKLYYNDNESAHEFLQSFFKEKAALVDKQFVSDDADFYPVLSDWEYGGILTLMDTKDFCNDHVWIAHRLNLSESRVHSVMSHLEKVGLVSKNEIGEYRKLHKSFNTSEDVNSSALRKAHTIEMKLASLKQDQVDVNDRDFGSLTVAIEKNKLPQIKKKMREFISQLEKTFESENSDEVYMLTYQMFPLTTLALEQKDNLQ